MRRAVESRSHQLAPLAAAVTTFFVDAAVLPDLQKTEEASGIRRRNQANGHQTCQLINYSMLQKHFINKFDSGTSLLSMTKMLRIKIISRNAAVAKKQTKLYHFRKMCKLFNFSDIHSSCFQTWRCTTSGDPCYLTSCSNTWGPNRVSPDRTRQQIQNVLKKTEH